MSKSPSNSNPILSKDHEVEEPESSDLSSNDEFQDWETDDFDDVLSRSPSSISLADQDQEQLNCKTTNELQAQLEHGQIGVYSGTLFTKGTLWGWTKKMAVVQDNALNLYDKISDFVMKKASLSLELEDCEAIHCNEAKYGREFCFELIIPNPRNIYVFAVNNVEEHARWCLELSHAGKSGGLSACTLETMTNEQKIILQEMKERLGPAELRDAPDRDLLRFLKATSFHLHNSILLWNDSQAWRRQFNVNGLNILHVVRELRLRKILLLPSADKNGRPVMVYFPHRHDPLTSSPLEVCKGVTYLLEHCEKCRLKDGVEDITFIIDFRDLRPRNVDLRVPKMLIETIQYRYPCRVGRFLLINVPWFFRYFWSTVQSFYHPQILQRVHILGSDLTTLQAFVSTESLLREHGGVLDYDVEEFIKNCAAGEKLDYPPPSFDLRPEEVMSDSSVREALMELSAAEVQVGAVHVGWMTKLGGLVRNWKRRFFVLTKASLLYYFKEETSLAPQGIVLLERSTVGPGISEAATPFSFTLITPLRTYIFCLESGPEMDTWKEMLGVACSKV